MGPILSIYFDLLMRKLYKDGYKKYALTSLNFDYLDLELESSLLWFDRLLGAGAGEGKLVRVVVHNRRNLKFTRIIVFIFVYSNIRKENQGENYRAPFQIIV